MIKLTNQLRIKLIVKERSIVDRQQTMKIFKKESKHPQRGRFYVNELWSDKYQKSILKVQEQYISIHQDTHIQKQLDQVSQLMRRNVEDIIEDVHNAVVEPIEDIKSSLLEARVMSEKYLQSNRKLSRKKRKSTLMSQNYSSVIDLSSQIGYHDKFRYLIEQCEDAVVEKQQEQILPIHRNLKYKALSLPRIM